MNRLHPSTLIELDPAVAVPTYDRAALQCGIVHLGLGAFHRAHQAVYTDAAIERSGGDWGIIGISMRSAQVARQLQPQAGLYSVLSEDRTGSQLRVIGAIKEVLVAPESPAAVAAAIARQSIALVTLTITEKGYALAADGRSLNGEDPAIRADLANPERPQSAIGLLALGLRERVAAGGAPLTLLSCDNLSANSRALRAVLADYLSACFPAVLPWLDSATTFPCSMVDRVVPAMTDARRQRQAERLGLRDEGAVGTEPFSQWIIEDDFAAGKPDWASAGAQFVADILPFENIKLRLLNASHSAIAYCGLLAGLTTVDQVMADAGLNRFVQRLMVEDLMPALDVPAGFDLDRYRGQLLARFGNPCLEHRCQQIAMDGSEKIRQRWLPRLQSAPAPLQLTKALSAWCYFILYTELPIDDPRGERLRELRSSTAPAREKITGALDCAGITPRTVGAFGALCDALARDLEILARTGIRSLLASM